MRAKEVAGLFIMVGAFSISAQERIPAGPPPNGPTFDVVSIKRVTEIRNSRRNGTLPGGKYVIEGMTISPAIREAYPADTNELLGAPDWVSSEIYDIAAYASGEVPREQIQAMPRAMLAERFKLAVHFEILERPVFALRLARAEGRLGPQLRRSDFDCDAIRKARSAGSKGPFPPTGNGAPACTIQGRGADDMQVLLGGGPLSLLIGFISSDAGRVIVDKTGLTGNYEATLRYTPQGSTDTPADRSPGLFTALQEQLGLKLEADRAPLRVLVIDRIERPSEN